MRPRLGGIGAGWRSSLLLQMLRRRASSGAKFRNTFKDMMNKVEQGISNKVNHNQGVNVHVRETVRGEITIITIKYNIYYDAFDWLLQNDVCA